MISLILIKLLYAIVWLITSPLRLFDDVALDSGITTAIAEIKNYFVIVDPFISTTTLLVVFGSMLAIEISIGVYKIIMWVIKKIPTIS